MCMPTTNHLHAKPLTKTACVVRLMHAQRAGLLTEEQVQRRCVGLVTRLGHPVWTTAAEHQAVLFRLAMRKRAGGRRAC